MSNPWTLPRAIELAGVIAEAGLGELTLEVRGVARTLKARTTDLPGILTSTPEGRLRSDAWAVAWAQGEITVHGEGPAARSIRVVLAR
jgi:hypothetical protein